MGISALFSEPFYTGAAALSDTPYFLPVAIGGKQYLIDLKKYQRQTISQIRPPSDTSSEPGEQSLTQEGLWKRSQSTFRMGAGQEYFDEEESMRQRYFSSKGVDPWTHKVLKLLKDTVNMRASVNTNLKVLQVGTRLFIADGSTLYWVDDPTAAWTPPNLVPVTGGTGLIISITTDGNTVFYSQGSEIRKVVPPAAASSLVTATATDTIGYANGRLVAGTDDVIREVKRDGSLVEIKNHENPDFNWRTICSAPNAIYIGGTCGDRSEIYATTALDSNGALSPPTFATSLPDGEVLLSMIYYGGAILLGTTRGVRLAAIGSNNSLNYGPVIEIDGGVYALEGQGEYVWFTWTAYDSVSSGLGRLDLSRFTREMVPAYASDLMATTQNVVLGVCTVGDRRYFAVSGVGFFGESANYVASGTYNSGQINYGTTEKKIATALDMRHKPLPAGASIAATITTEEEDSVPIGSSTKKGSLSPVSTLSIEVEQTEAVSIGLTLNRTATRTTIADGVTTNGSKTVTSATAAFTQNDVGQDIIGAGIPAGAFIEIVSNATTVQISAPATATASNVVLTIGDATKTPELRRWTLFVRVTPVLSDEIIVPLIIKDWVQTQLGEGEIIYYNPLDEFQSLQDLADGKTIVRYQEGAASYNCYVTMVKVEPSDWNADRSFYNGIIYVRLVTIDVT